MIKCSRQTLRKLIISPNILATSVLGPSCPHCATWTPLPLPLTNSTKVKLPWRVPQREAPKSSNRRALSYRKLTGTLIRLQEHHLRDPLYHGSWDERNLYPGHQSFPLLVVPKSLSSNRWRCIIYHCQLVLGLWLLPRLLLRLSIQPNC